jgi:hypothetical protein
MGVSIKHVVIALGLSACASDEPGSGLPNNGTMSAKIDGVAWRASNTRGLRSSNSIIVLGANNEGHSLSITADHVTAPGTYPVGPAGGPDFTILRNGDLWDTPDDGTGALVITSYTPGGMAGTFSFVAVQGSFTKDVTNGAFSVTFD